MKKLLSLSLAIVLCMALTFALVGCNKQAKIPEGYKLYEYWDGRLSFAIPEDWVATEITPTLIMKDGATSGNNIVVTKEPLTLGYRDLTNENFDEVIGQVLKQKGYSNIVHNVEQKNNGAHKVSVVEYSALYYGQPLRQIMYAVNSLDGTFVIAITLVNADDELVQTVYDTIRV